MQNKFNKEISDLSSTDFLWEKLEQEKFDEVIQEASIFLNHKSKALVKDASKLLGMCFFHQGKYAEALPYFQEVSKYRPEISDWFNIVTSSTLSKNIEIGRKAFDEAIKLHLDLEQGEPSIPAMRYYYACALRDIEEYELALEQINKLRLLYEQLKITDSTFLHIRGIPFLSHTMAVAIDVFNGLGSNFNALEWIDSFSLHLDKEGQEYLKKIKNSDLKDKG